MKNFPPEFYFEQTLSIVNTLKTAGPSRCTKLPATIQFFPEGGTAVYGIAGKNCIQSNGWIWPWTGLQGMSLSISKMIPLPIFNPSQRHGNFQLRPEKNNSYYAILRLHDSLIKQKIPDPEEHGFVMNVTGNEGTNYPSMSGPSPDL